MNLYTKIKSKFSANTIAHERASGGSGSNPFFMQSSWKNLFGRYANTQVDYNQEVGDLMQSRLIMAAVNFMGRSLPEANLEIVKPKGDGTNKVLPAHPIVSLFMRPNKYYTGDLLWKSFGLSWIISGNVYFYKVRNKLNEVIELWYLPHQAVEPRWEGGNFIDYYAYQIDGQEIRLKPSDVIHFRNGIDPHNTRMGLSDIASALREIYTDNEAANFSALLMKNCGVGPFVISPKETQTSMDATSRARISDAFQRKISGDQRGKPIVNSVALEITKTGFTPDEMNLAQLRRVPEETIASLTGIPAIVLQFGAGLEKATYSNYEEAKASAFEGAIVPLWRYIASELTHQLVSDFDKSEKLQANFNTSNVRVLQDDENRLVNRLAVAYRGGFMKRSEARSKIGLLVDKSDEVYIHETGKQTSDKPVTNTVES